MKKGKPNNWKSIRLLPCITFLIHVSSMNSYWRIWIKLKKLSLFFQCSNLITESTIDLFSFTLLSSFFFFQNPKLVFVFRTYAQVLSQVWQTLFKHGSPEIFWCRLSLIFRQVVFRTHIFRTFLKTLQTREILN